MSSLRLYEMDANFQWMSDYTHFRFTFLTYLAVASDRIIKQLQGNKTFKSFNNINIYNATYKCNLFQLFLKRDLGEKSSIKYNLGTISIEKMYFLLLY